VYLRLYALFDPDDYLNKGLKNLAGTPTSHAVVSAISDLMLATIFFNVSKQLKDVEQSRSEKL